MPNLPPYANQPQIVGAGLAGLEVALELAEQNISSVVYCSGDLGEQASSVWAQGGIAAAVAPDDKPSYHAKDTIEAGAGTCDPKIVELVTNSGREVIERLSNQSVVFDRDANGQWQVGLEGAHSHHRIVHIKGDGAGRAIMQAIVKRARAKPQITILEHTKVIDLRVGANGIEGIVIMQNGKAAFLPANRVVLATGGAGALWRHTTNPLGSWGAGLALAAKAGAQLADLEFMQFHPTAIDIGRDPMPLASEALRGEGAVLIDENGERFMNGFKRQELEPRDVVSRAIWAHLGKGHKVFLDARKKSTGIDFKIHFPAIYEMCMQGGIDPSRMPIPVRPAAHYHMGGVLVNDWGLSSISGLWACGEVSSTGLHGANRLASNSLLEAAFFGARVAQDIAGRETKPASVKRQTFDFRTPAANDIAQVRDIISAHAGVLRDKEGLTAAIKELAPLAEHSDMALVGMMITVAAVLREESRGSHTRTDFPEASPVWAHRQILSLDDIRDYAQGLTAGTFGRPRSLIHAAGAAP